MDVVLINSPLFIENSLKDDCEDLLPPLGLAYIATALEAISVRVSIIDAANERLSLITLMELIAKLKPQYIGINIFSSNQFVVKEFIESIDFSTHILVGGPGTSTLYQDILNWRTLNKVDVIIGDGEIVVPNIILGNIDSSEVFILNGNRRVFKINDQSSYYVRNLSTSKINHKWIKEPIKNNMGVLESHIVTSRGCIYNCSFCSAASILNRHMPIRERTCVSIITEINEIIDLYPTTCSIRILDDLFLKTPDSILQAINIFSNYNLSWRSMSHIKTFNSIDKDTLIKLRKSGCEELFVGIESGSPRILRLINKTSDVNLILRNLIKIFEAGISVKGYFIIGFPGESRLDLDLTYELAYKIKQHSIKANAEFRTSVFEFRPYKGTMIYEKIRQKNENITIRHNMELTRLIGRSQFNFQSNNFSHVSQKTIHDYICKIKNI